MLDALERRNLVLGGEQSGHVIFADHATTGDGTLTGIVLLDTMVPARAVALRARVGDHAGPAGPPQRRGRRCRPAPRRHRLLEPRCRDVDDELGDDGRVLVRPSGTEPLVRVMVESTDADAAAEAADRLVELVEHAASRSAPARL